MRGKTLIQKTLFLSASHFAVRSVGFLLRLWLSRELGAQTMGLVELAQSAQMLLITPVVTGLPVAVSRMCAKTEGARRVRVVRCALLLALPISLLIAALAFLFREPLCLWLGDVQTLPALLCFLPCIPILGASCVLNGYYYGIASLFRPPSANCSNRLSARCCVSGWSTVCAAGQRSFARPFRLSQLLRAKPPDSS
ncbi:MAG: oligosaccharide flippase family protein [Christensenellales bacterium]